MPRDVDFGPIFTDSYVGAKNTKNTRGFGMKSKGKTQEIQTHTTRYTILLCSAWLERPSPIESQGRDRKVESLARDRKITG